MRSLATRPVLGIHSLPCVSLASPRRDDKGFAVKHLTAVYPPFSHVVLRRLALVARYLCPDYLPDVCEACHGNHRRNVSVSSAFSCYLSQRLLTTSSSAQDTGSRLVPLNASIVIC